jgi:hypothetical protein
VLRTGGLFHAETFGTPGFSALYLAGYQFKITTETLWTTLRRFIGTEFHIGLTLQTTKLRHADSPPFIYKIHSIETKTEAKAKIETGIKSSSMNIPRGFHLRAFT